MIRRQSLDDEINELKILRQTAKKIVTSQDDDKYKREKVPIQNERPKYLPNPPQTARIRTSSERYFNTTSVHVKPEPTSNYNKSTLNTKPALASIYPVSPSSPRIVRPNSSRKKGNHKSKSKKHIHISPLEPKSSSNSPRNTTPKILPTPPPVKTIEKVESKPTLSQKTIAPLPPPQTIPKPPIKQSVFTRVRFESHILNRFKRMNSNKYYKFGMKLLDNNDFDPRSIRYLKIAADQNHLKAIIQLSRLLYDGYQIDQPNFEKKINSNTVQPKSNPIYYGIHKNRSEAAKYLKIATDMGDLQSMRKYREMLYNGDGVKKDRKTAANYYKIDADSGDLPSITKYATMLYVGDGIDQDFKEAGRYFTIAVEKGDTYAMRMLGQMYRTGSGVDYDLQESIKYYRMAADLGDDEALKELVRMMDNGCKMFLRSKDAAMYYKMAADKGDKNAMKKYKELMWNRI